MTTIAVKEARENFGELINKTAYGKERFIITRNKKPSAALISIEDLKILEIAIEALEYQHDLSEARKAIKEIETEGTISWKEVKNRLGL
jgi:prevent-host-death family protein